MHSTCDMKIEKKFLILWGVIMFMFLVITDQLTKHFIVIHSDLLYRNPLTIIPGFLNVVTVRNTGAAWGMFHGNNVVLLIVAIAALVGFTAFFKAITEWYPERVLGFFMIESGIVGNSMDRIFRGSVVDFMDFYINNWHWPAFNVADSAICVGVTIIIVSTIFRSVKQSGF
jgi:signal peptidase II